MQGKKRTNTNEKGFVWPKFTHEKRRVKNLRVKKFKRKKISRVKNLRVKKFCT